MAFRALASASKALCLQTFTSVGRVQEQIMRQSNDTYNEMLFGRCALLSVAGSARNYSHVILLCNDSLMSKLMLTGEGRRRSGCVESIDIYIYYYISVYIYIYIYCIVLSAWYSC